MNNNNYNKIATEITEPEPIRKIAFTSRYYKAIADVISKSDSVDEVIERLVELFNEDNARFDELRFREA